MAKSFTLPLMRCFSGIPSLLLAIVVLLSGCVAPQSRPPEVDGHHAQEEARKQRELVVDDYMREYRRLQNVAARVIVRSASLCGTDVGPYYGMSAWNQENFSGDWRAMAQIHLGLGDEVRISLIAPESAAERARLKEGDTVLAVNGKSIETGKGAPDKFLRMAETEGKSGLPVTLLVRRGGAEVELALLPVQGCDFRVHLDPGSVRNAFADGRNIVIFKGMMDFFRTDEEIALVVSHELAHNAMKHIEAQKTNATVGGLIGLLLDVAAAAGGVNTNGDFTRLGSNMGALAYSVEFEQEADYVGLYLMAQAGYKIDDAAGFWRRMATLDANAISIKTTHPTTPERFVALEGAIREIQQKMTAGQPLTPEFKSPRPAAQ